MKIDEVCEEWPKKGERIKKWLDLDDAISHIVSNGRFSAFKALLRIEMPFINSISTLIWWTISTRYFLETGRMRSIQKRSVKLAQW